MIGAEGCSRVLVTRPEPEASQTAARLKDSGYAPVILPLFETTALAAQVSSIPDGAGAVAITSANAIRHVSRDIVDALQHLDCFCVGAKTADAARSIGFSSVIEGPGDAEGLAAMIVDSAFGGTLVYLCGRVRKPDLEAAARTAAIAVVAVEVYDTRAIARSHKATLSVLQGATIDIALVYSVNAAHALDGLGRAPGISHLFEETEFLCISDRVAAALSGDKNRRILASPEPTEEALLLLMGTSGKKTP